MAQYHAGETTTDPEDYASSADEDTIVVSVMENEGGNVTVRLHHQACGMRSLTSLAHDL